MLGLAGDSALAAIARLAFLLRKQRRSTTRRTWRDRRVDRAREPPPLLDELEGPLRPAMKTLPHRQPGPASDRPRPFQGDQRLVRTPHRGRLLRRIGPRIRQVVRHSDLVARLGGDEFAVLLHGEDTLEATTVAQRLSRFLEEPIDVGTASLRSERVSASHWRQNMPELRDLLRCADIAMYRAKKERGSFDVYEAVLDDETDRFALIEDLRRAMADGSLALHYQPEIDLRTGQVVTVEVFLRWPHPTLGLIPPEHLLVLAEESGLIQPLTAWVFEQAIADCAQWWREGRQVAVAVQSAGHRPFGFGACRSAWARSSIGLVWGPRPSFSRSTRGWSWPT